MAFDRLVGLTLIMALIVLGFRGLDLPYESADAAAVLAVTFLLNVHDTTPRVE